jgi:hypothetical protein
MNVVDANFQSLMLTNSLSLETDDRILSHSARLKPTIKMVLHRQSTWSEN